MVTSNPCLIYDPEQLWRKPGHEERTTQPHAQCRKSFKSRPHQGQAIHGAFMHKGRVIHFSDHPLSRVIGEAPGQGAQKRERETLNDHSPPRPPDASSTHLTSSLVALDSFLNFLPPPPYLRHFHLCSLGPSEEYEMATRQQGYIRSPWFFESHSKSMSSSHSSPSSEVKMKGNWMPLPNMCPSASESGVLSTRPSPQSCPPKRSALLFPRESQGSF